MERLPIYLPDQQMGVYNPQDPADQVVQRIAAKDTKLLTFFKLNQTDTNAHNLRYSDIPYHYCWKSSPPQWKRCGNQIHSKVEEGSNIPGLSSGRQPL